MAKYCKEKHLKSASRIASMMGMDDVGMMAMMRMRGLAPFAGRLFGMQRLQRHPAALFAPVSHSRPPLFQLFRPITRSPVMAAADAQMEDVGVSF